MKSFLLRLCVTVFGSIIFSASALAEKDATDDLHQRLEAITSLQGDFTQMLIDADGTLLDESQGQFAMQRPGLFRWHTSEPFEQLLVSDGDVVWLYDPDLEQVTVRPVSDQLQQTPAVLISGDLSDLRATFDVAKLPDNSELFMLYPKSEESLFDSLTLVFAEQQLTEIRVRDSLGQLTRFQLQNVARNRPVDRELFHFEAPEGTDVLID